MLEILKVLRWNALLDPSKRPLGLFFGPLGISWGTLGAILGIQKLRPRKTNQEAPKRPPRSSQEAPQDQKLGAPKPLTLLCHFVARWAGGVTRSERNNSLGQKISPPGPTKSKHNKQIDNHLDPCQQNKKKYENHYHSLMSEEATPPGDVCAGIRCLPQTKTVKHITKY